MYRFSIFFFSYIRSVLIVIYCNCVPSFLVHFYAMTMKLSTCGSQVMGVDISPDGKLIATSSYDRTFKLWMSE